MKRTGETFTTQLLAGLKTVSMASRILFLIVLFGYLLSFSESVVKSLSITPTYLLPPHFWIWTILTSPFIETSIFVAIADLACIHLCGKLVEPLWGAKEILVYFLLVNSIVAVLTTFFYIFIYLAFFDIEQLFFVSIHGLMGFNGAATVAVKQLLPDQALLTTPVGRLKNAHIPCLVCLFCILLTVTRLMNSAYLVMYIFGATIGWIYLRFYQLHNNGTRGDQADHFSFASFFPSVLQPTISVFANVVFRGLVQLKICKPQTRRFTGLADIPQVVTTLPGIDPQDAERRRQKAIRDLSERMKLRESTTPAWPVLDESGGSDLSGGVSPAASSVVQPSPDLSQQQPSPRPHGSKATDAAEASDREPLLQAGDANSEKLTDSAAK